MSLLRQTGYSVFLAGIALWPISCKKPQPGTGLPEVPVKVWVVLAVGESIAEPQPGGPLVCISDNSTPCTTDDDCDILLDGGDQCVTKVNGRDNIGCRLTRPEIEAYITQLRSNNHAFGGVEFSPLPFDIQQAQDPILTRPQQVINFEDHTVQDYWAAETLNIYFTGEVVDPPSGEFVGLNVDPRDAGVGGRAYILIIDSSSTDPDYVFDHWTRMPNEQRKSLVLEHELAHFFLSRGDCSSLGYDVIPMISGQEHVPAGSDNILADPFDGTTVEIPLSETVEIMCRIVENTWWKYEDCCSPCACPDTPLSCCNP